jgi:ADP-ribose pyrophosphatase YjhB (NUDIX family)
MKKKNGGRPFGRRPEEGVPYFKLHPEVLRRTVRREEDNPTHKSVLAVLLRDGANGEPDILLVHKRIPSTWALPGGGVEAGENPKEALLCKVREKTGYNIVGVPELMLRQRATETHEKVVFLARVSESCDPPSSDEIDGVRWFTIGEITSMPHYPYNSKEVNPETDCMQESQRADILNILKKKGFLANFPDVVATANF